MNSEIIKFEQYLDNLNRNKNGYNIQINELSSLLRIREKISNINFLKDFFSKRKNEVKNKFIQESNLFNNYIEIKETDEHDNYPSKLVNKLFNKLKSINLENNNLKKIRFSFTIFKIKSDDLVFNYRTISYYTNIIFGVKNILYLNKKYRVVNSKIKLFEKDLENSIKSLVFNKNDEMILEKNELIDKAFESDINLSLILKLDKEDCFLLCAENEEEKDIILKINKLVIQNKIFREIVFGFLKILSKISSITYNKTSNLKLDIFKEMLYLEMFFFENFINYKLIILETEINDVNYELITQGTESYDSREKDKQIVVKENKIELYFKNFNIFLIINSLDNFNLVYNKFDLVLNQYQNFCNENYLKSKYLYFNIDRLNEKIFFEFDNEKNLINISNLFWKGFTFFINLPFNFEKLNFEKIEYIKFEDMLKEQISKNEILKLFEESKNNNINSITSLAKILIRFNFSKDDSFSLFFEEEEKDKIVKNAQNEVTIPVSTNKGLDEAIITIENKVKSIFKVSRDDIINSLKNIDLKKIKFKDEEINNTILSCYFNPEKLNNKKKTNVQNKRASTVLNIIGLKNNPIISNMNQSNFVLKKKKSNESFSKKSSFNDTDESGIFNYGNDILESINEFNWDNLDILDEDLYIYSWSIFDSIGIVDDYDISEKKYSNFIKEVHYLYNEHKNPYHNFKHGIMVLHNCFYFIKNTIAGKYFNEIGVTALIFSGLMHDISHTGKNNFYEINSLSDLALTHNDYSVLESHHVSTAFKLIKKEKFSIFNEMDNDTFKIFRKYCIIMILHTDMSFHFKNVSNFKEKIESKTFFPYQEGVDKDSNEQDFELFSGILIHTADLYIPTKEIEDSSRWSDLVNFEFKKQYELEKKNNLPFFPFYKDLDKQDVVCNNEIQFIDKMVKPLWVCLNDFLDNNLKDHITNIDKVLENWKKKLEDIKSK